MRKLLFFIVLSFIGITACSKNDDKSLAGTTWKYQETGYTSTIYFESGSRFSAAWAEDDLSGTDKGTYSYDPPKVTFVDESGEVSYAIISGNEMQMQEGDNFVFIKQ